MLNYIVSGLEIIIALELIIFVHELGHFLAAKLFGVRVREFALGMGPVVFKRQRGETQYSLRGIPVGGFVDLAAEQPGGEDAADPRGLSSKPAWQRIIVFASGVVMNAVLAIVLITVASFLGIWVMSPEVGGVVKGMPAAAAGIKVGDRVVAINGARVDSFEDVLYCITSHNAGSAFTVTVDRPEPGSARPRRITFENIQSERDPRMPMPMIGVMPVLESVVGELEPGSLAAQAGLQEDDRLLEVNGRPVTRMQEVTALLAEAPAGPVTLKIRRGEGTTDLRVDPAKLRNYKMGMLPPVVVNGVEKGGPAAAAGVQVGDRVAAVNDKPWPALEQLSDTIKSGEAGSLVRLALWRSGQLVDVTCRTVMMKENEKPKPGEKPAPADEEKSAAAKKERPRIGVALGLAAGDPVQIGSVDGGGAADEAHLRPGDVIVGVGDGGHRPRDWPEMLQALVMDASLESSKPTILKIQRGQTELATRFRPEGVPVERFTFEQLSGDVFYVPLPRIVNPLAALERGFKRTVQMIGRAYVSIKQLVTGQVGTEMMAGPVGIAQASFKIASKGPGTFIDFWGMLSVFIAVLNFLPLPPLDGGHVLFIFIEKVKGSPVPAKTRNIIWIAGWILFILLILFATGQDIWRLIPTSIRRLLPLP